MAKTMHNSLEILQKFLNGTQCMTHTFKIKQQKHLLYPLIYLKHFTFSKPKLCCFLSLIYVKHNPSSIIIFSINPLCFPLCKWTKAFPILLSFSYIEKAYFQHVERWQRQYGKDEWKQWLSWPAISLIRYCRISLSSTNKAAK